ncbi:probable protein phosphatase 2C 51 [Cynara cardunculus var. scolymus]|uniref:protein-serine/threonine phosphatase n=1 Tax=Cynara cardunculus var. scolymus TaxID=59895 RepID=A0A103YDI7_CYNCS|nr:probable protein phosphatase 2C 51 [Cynara cardunculus var. scolymus]KVI07107.1 Protein phosphatase 2C [Cynara cardunculus var. scolymus]
MTTCTSVLPGGCCFPYLTAEIHHFYVPISPYTYPSLPTNYISKSITVSSIVNMMIANMEHTISSSPSLTSCRQSAGFSDKSDAVLSRRRRTELRRLKLLTSNGSDDCLSKRRRFENIENEGDHDFPYHSSVIGRRREMEDAVRIDLGFVHDDDSRKFDFYGVYDGHGGSRVAYACRERLHKLLAGEMEMKNGTTAAEEMNWEDLMVECFSKMDDEVNETDLVGSMGSTAVVAVVGDKEIVIANCGDSRAVLSAGGAAMPLSNDHKPDRPDELERIEHLGGRVIDWNGQRVLGVLATSRSIGDKQLKPYVTAKPEVIVHKRDGIEEFMILASDGLWDVMSNDLACHVVRKCLDGRIFRRRSQQMNATMKGNKPRATNAAVVLTELAIARGSKDNISVIVVNLKD